MSNRVSISEVLTAAAQVGSMMRQLGLTEGYPEFSEGSKTYGHAFRLNIVKPGGSGHYNLPPHLGSDFLGMTKREAFEELQHKRAILWALAEPIDGEAFGFDHAEIDRVVTVALKRRFVNWRCWTETAPWKMDGAG